MSGHDWQGRAVEFRDYSIADGREIRQAFEADNERGTFTLLSKALYYQDTGERVFATAAEIDAVPHRYLGRLLKLAAAIAEEETRKAEDPT